MSGAVPRDERTDRHDDDRDATVGPITAAEAACRRRADHRGAHAPARVLIVMTTAAAAAAPVSD